MAYNLCACMGAMYNEPYCYCEMERRGLDMDNNPLRIAAEEECAKQMLPGGSFYEWLRNNPDDSENRAESCSE